MAVKALVLIGGFGTRLRPVTLTVPKQLIPIAGKPLLEHVLDRLPPDVEEVVLATGYKADEIGAYLRAHPPRFPYRIVTESSPLGSGGAMRFAGAEASDPFYLLNSDVIAEIDLAALRDLHLRHGGLGAMALATVEDTRPYGVAALEEDRIVRFVEKPAPEEAPSHWINAGFAVWSRAVLEAIPAGRMVSFEQEILPGLLDRGIYGLRMHGYFEDAGTPERLLHAQRLLFDSGRATGTRAERPLVAVGTRAVVDGASLEPYTTIDDDVRIERGARVANSVVMHGAQIGAGARVAGSIVGPGARVAAGTRLTDRILGAEERV